MADSDYNDNQDSGVLIPGTAAVIGAGATATAVAAAAHSPQSVEKRLASATPDLEKAVARRDAELRRLKLTPEERKLQQAHASAVVNSEAATKHLAEQTARIHADAIANLSGGAKGEMEIAGLRGEIEHLNSLPDSVLKAQQVGAREAQIAALEKHMATPEFKELTKDGADAAKQAVAHTQIQEVLEKSAQEYHGANPLPPRITAEVQTKFAVDNHKALEAARTKGIESALPAEVQERVANGTKLAQTDVAATARELEEAKTAWKPIEKAKLGKVGRTAENAEATVRELTVMKDLNQSKGIWAALKRPFTMLKEGRAGTKMLILVPTAAMGAAVYSHMHREPEPQQEEMGSFAAREQQRRMAAAAARANGQGIA